MDRKKIEDVVQYAFESSGLHKACDDLKITHLLDSAKKVICEKLSTKE